MSSLKGLALAAASPGEGEDPMPEDGMGDALPALAEDILAAVKGGDAGALAGALEAFVQGCSDYSDLEA